MLRIALAHQHQTYEDWLDENQPSICWSLAIVNPSNPEEWLRKKYLSQASEGFAFFCWHRLRWPDRTEHTNGCAIPSCQKDFSGEWACRAIWEFSPWNR